MKRILLTFLITLVSGAAVAGPTIVESGGYTFLPGLKLTGTQGLLATQSGGAFLGIPPSIAGSGLTIGSLSSFGALCVTTAGVYSLANCALYSQALDTFINAPASFNVVVRISNATKATFGTSALLLPSGVDLQTTQAQKLTFDGATAAKYLSSDGTTLTLTGLNLTVPTVTSNTFISLAAFNAVAWTATGQGLIVTDTASGVRLNQSGVGTTQSMIGGMMDRSVTANTNTNAGETTLYTFSMPGNTLNIDTRAIRIFTNGITANNGNAKTIRVKFGGTTAFTLATSTAQLSWSATVDCARTAAATQVCVGRASFGSVNQAVAVTTPAETLSGAVTISVTGQATTTADITHSLTQLYYVP